MFEKHMPSGNDRAVSPVIGVVLMVGIVVALGAVVGAAVLGLGVGVGDTAPNAQFDATYDADAGGDGIGALDVEHVAGDTVDANRLDYTIAGDSEDTPDSGFASGEEITAGDTATFDEASADADDDFGGETFSIQWESENGETSSVLFEYEIPA